MEKNKKLDTRIYLLLAFLLVIISGIWYFQHKSKIDLVFEDKSNELVSDLEKLKFEEKSLVAVDSTESISTQPELVNINVADAETLEELPAIGETIAISIIKYREENGGFKTIEEIKNVARIGDKTFEQIKNKITIQ